MVNAEHPDGAISPEVREHMKRIRERIPHQAGRDLEAAFASYRTSLEIIFRGALDEHAERDVSEAENRIREEYSTTVTLEHTVATHTAEWYFRPPPGSRWWPALRGYLIEGKEFAEEDVDSIDRLSTEVLSRCWNPADTEFQGRGLVVGHVQSGKTANMAAVIAKAVDAGYNTVIVLAGMTNKLRYQTQERLVEDIVDRYPDSPDWAVLTPNNPDEDFKAPTYRGFLNHPDLNQLAVVKKVVAPLQQLLKAIDETPRAALKELRVLLIDDECDQASVNAPDKRFDITTINKHIREILDRLPAVTYVGYTATPFANVLIDPYGQHVTSEGRELDDLYPRDFITALPTPASYFGAEKLFGRAPLDADDAGVDGLDMVRSVPLEDVGMLQPAKAGDRDDFTPRMANSLIDSVLYFLATCAARRARCHAHKHMTMLIHTSAYQTMHKKISNLVQGWVGLHGPDVARRTGEFARRLEEIWAWETGRVPNDLCDAAAIGIDEVFENLPAVLEKVEFPIENAAGDRRLDYSRDQPRTYIVVGGTVLARGLTLDGLCVSYFLRRSNQYDTLLQMGRWFGYRHGYEDLPRIWMTDDLQHAYRELASIEAEIRDEIAVYTHRRVTPLDFAVRIRSIPGFAITAATKTRAARVCDVSYWGKHIQTLRFPRSEKEELDTNWQAGADLINVCDGLDLRDEKAAASVWRGVPVASIVRFLDEYRVNEFDGTLQPTLLRPFIEGTEELRSWNVAIVEPVKGPESAEALGSVGKVRMSRRARLKGFEPAYIKALMSSRDVLIDCPAGVGEAAGWAAIKDARAREIGRIPLLLLYPIDRRSESGSKAREPLDAVADVLGFGIVFPSSSGAPTGDFVSVELQPYSADEEMEIDMEDQAESNADPDAL